MAASRTTKFVLINISSADTFAAVFSSENAINRHRRLFNLHQVIDLPSISLKSPPANQDNCGIRAAHFPNFIIVDFAKISVVNSSSMVFKVKRIERSN